LSTGHLQGTKTSKSTDKIIDAPRESVLANIDSNNIINKIIAKIVWGFVISLIYLLFSETKYPKKKGRKNAKIPG
jgi:hypothetical protein